MSFKTKKWKIFTLIHLENEAIILLFVQQKPKHDQVAFLCSGVGVNAFFWCRSLTECFWKHCLMHSMKHFQILFMFKCVLHKK